ncbi:hypothetical protein HJC23_000621 [Cyclotella cryptica]|uniref:Arb2 domain-containing protein n=1 Tax=Cyclotella cryptica TaxID=29204 RepID=A0ABD3Q6P8_9STRA
MKNVAPRKSLRQVIQHVLSMGNHPSTCCAAAAASNNNDDSRQSGHAHSGCFVTPSSSSFTANGVDDAKPIPPGFVLLHGCQTMEEHERRVEADLNMSLGGEEGLYALGFQFRFVPCRRHVGQCGYHVSDYGRELQDEEVQRRQEQIGLPNNTKNAVNYRDELSQESNKKESIKKVRFDFSCSFNNNNDDVSRIGWHACKECVTRLFYIGTGNEDAERQVLEESCDAIDCVDHSVKGEELSLTSCADKESEGHETMGGSLKAAETLDADMNHTQKLECEDSNSSTDDKSITAADSSSIDKRPSTPDESLSSTECNTLQNSKVTSTIGTTPQTSPTLTPITPANRQTYIADGKHYELLTKLAQEAAHDIMRRTFDLEWVTICNDAHHDEEVRALVDSDHRLLFLREDENREVVEELLGVCHHVDHGEDEKKERDEAVLFQSQQQQQQQLIHDSTIDSHKEMNTSTLLIATGRGKVRAGIFSRFHLLTAGIEVGTAWHNIREARMRDMGVVIIDPNARGEHEGMETFKRSVRGLFTRAVGKMRPRGERSASPTTAVIDQQQETRELQTSSSPSSPMNLTSSIYILAHSASGGQLVRHLREDPSLLPSIRAIAFTDSTHNVQWCKDDPSLMNFLSTNHCIYLRSNDVRSSQSCIHVSSRGKDIACQCVNCTHNRKNAGVVADTDSFWEHRFGKIRTLWAGTADHALSNWAGHDHIWLHFDRHAAKGGVGLNRAREGS